MNTIDEKLARARDERLNDAGQLLALEPEEVTAGLFRYHGDALKRQDPIKYAAIQRNLMTQFVKSQMTEGHDYGVIPGTQEKALYKAGAERLGTFFDMATAIECVENESHYDKGFFAYTYKAIVRDKNNRPIAECEGHCNSKEKKYAYRWVPEKFATDEQKKSQVARKESQKYRGTFDLQVPNPEIFDQVNTIRKMAQKRAIVGAIILACNATGFFKNAENLHDVEIPENRQTWEGETIDAEVVPEPQIISDAQRKRFWAIANNAGYSKEAVKLWLESMGIESTSAIEKSQYDLLCKQAEQPVLAKFWNAQVNSEIPGLE